MPLPFGLIKASGSSVKIKFWANQIEPGGFCQGAVSVSLRQAHGPVHLIKLYKPFGKVIKHEVPEGAAPKV